MRLSKKQKYLLLCVRDCLFMIIFSWFIIIPFLFKYSTEIIAYNVMVFLGILIFVIYMYLYIIGRDNI
jgi:hypothetical protein